MKKLTAGYVPWVPGLLELHWGTLYVSVDTRSSLSAGPAGGRIVTSQWADGVYQGSMYWEPC